MYGSRVGDTQGVGHSRDGCFLQLRSATRCQRFLLQFHIRPESHLQGYFPTPVSLFLFQSHSRDEKSASPQRSPSLSSLHWPTYLRHFFELLPNPDAAIGPKDWGFHCHHVPVDQEKKPPMGTYLYSRLHSRNEIHFRDHSVQGIDIHPSGRALPEENSSDTPPLLPLTHLAPLSP